MKNETKREMVVQVAVPNVNAEVARLRQDCGRYEAQRTHFEAYIDAFLAINRDINLLSRREESVFWEKHVVDSLALSYFFERFRYDYRGKWLLDVGTGGGLPAVPLAIYYPELQVVALDSIGKKIRAIEQIKEWLALKNLQTAIQRVEQYSGVMDLVTSRAVAALDKLLPVVADRVAYRGYFIAYKGSRAREELQDARAQLAKFGLAERAVIAYPLPIEGDYQRNLVVLQKVRK